MALAKDGVPIKQIVKRTGHSRGLVRPVIRGERADVFRVRQSSIEAYLPFLQEQWAACNRNGTELRRGLKRMGFRGSLRVVGEWSTRRRRAERADAAGLQRIPSARTIARMMSTGRDNLSKADAVIIAAIEAGVPALVEARDLVADFHAIIRRRAGPQLDPWPEKARPSLIAAFANGVTRDKAAAGAAIVLPWSNGQTEGQVTRLKLVKRQIYGARQTRSAAGQAHGCTMTAARRCIKTASEPNLRRNTGCLGHGRRLVRPLTGSAQWCGRSCWPTCNGDSPKAAAAAVRQLVSRRMPSLPQP